MSAMRRRAAIYARVSTMEQEPENQLLALRSFALARGWESTELVDHGISGVKEKRPQLDAMLAAVRARKVDVVLVTKLDRLARSVHHLVTMTREFEALGVELVVLDQAIDTTTASGKLLFFVLAAVSEFERDLIRDRVLAGMRRARAAGVKFGRPRALIDVRRATALLAEGRSLRQSAKALGCAASTLSAAVRAARQSSRLAAS